MVNENKAKIKEIFSSIQGEGLCIGLKQIFVRFCACNLHCNYCDTDFYPVDINQKTDYFDFTVDELIKYLESNFNIEQHHSISLTGGEPLIWVDFLKEFMPKFLKRHDIKFYLETNGTLSDNLREVLPYIDIVSSDIKLPSCSGLENSFELHNEFFKALCDTGMESGSSSDKPVFYAKVVFDSNIEDIEISKTVDLAKKYGLCLILQPKMVQDKFSVNSDFMVSVFDKFLSKYHDVRLIPQVHKYLDVE